MSSWLLHPNPKPPFKTDDALNRRNAALQTAGGDEDDVMPGSPAIRADQKRKDRETNPEEEYRTTRRRTSMKRKRLEEGCETCVWLELNYPLIFVTNSVCSSVKKSKKTEMLDYRGYVLQRLRYANLIAALQEQARNPVPEPTTSWPRPTLDLSGLKGSELETTRSKLFS
ncbi:hypothetical protein J6590_071407 [Homalodisca vitripennis]|nr:hypothetical protein J6590_071407 [Homalodisca vitripennis]